jgi:hypothetical protein
MAEIASPAVSPTPESLPVAPAAVDSSTAAQNSAVVPLPQLSGSVTVPLLSDSVLVPPSPAFHDLTTALGNGSEEVQSRVQASATAAADATLPANATTATGGTHVLAEASAAPVDHDMNPVLKTLQQLQVEVAWHPQIFIPLIPLQAMQDAGVSVDVSAGAR